MFPPVRCDRLRELTALEHDTREGGKLHCGNFRGGELHVIANRKSMGTRNVTAQRIVYAACLILAAWALGSCHHTPAQQQIRRSIAAAATAARVNDVSGVLAVVGDDFTGNQGDLDKRGLHRLLALRALRQDKTGVLVGPVSFERKGDRILAKFNLVLTGGKPGDLLPNQSAIYAMTTAWRREGGEWKCYSATWSR
jgi:ketosteroid isomerase-like protein